jgi:hypothetical protein
MLGAFSPMMIESFRAFGTRPQASADMIDDEHGITYTGSESIQNFDLVMEALKARRRRQQRDGGAATRVPWLAKARRVADNNRVSDVRHDSLTSPTDQPESSQNQMRVIGPAEVAMILGVCERTVYRWVKTDDLLRLTIVSEPGEPLRFDEEMVRGYAAAHPN